MFILLKMVRDNGSSDRGSAEEVLSVILELGGSIKSVNLCHCKYNDFLKYKENTMEIAIFATLFNHWIIIDQIKFLSYGFFDK